MWNILLIILILCSAACALSLYKRGRVKTEDGADLDIPGNHKNIHSSACLERLFGVEEQGYNFKNAKWLFFP
jgi:hypothetical protein